MRGNAPAGRSGGAGGLLLTMKRDGLVVSTEITAELWLANRMHDVGTAHTAVTPCSIATPFDRDVSLHEMNTELSIVAQSISLSGVEIPFVKSQLQRSDVGGRPELTLARSSTCC